jgi:hypothetical protein
LASNHSTDILSLNQSINNEVGNRTDQQFTNISVPATLSTSGVAWVTTGLTFTPLASHIYIIDGTFFVSTNLTTTAPRLSLNWSSGLTNGMGVWTLYTVTDETTTDGNISAQLLCGTGTMGGNNTVEIAILHGSILVGASPSGNITIGFQSATAGQTVKVWAGSSLSYRSW